MTAVKTHEFSVHLLKKKIASIVANRHKGNRTILQEKINDLTCQCIFAFSCWTMESNTRTEKKVLVEDQVSNVCLRMLNFLILDGEDRIDNNLKTLYEQCSVHMEKNIFNNVCFYANCHFFSKHIITQVYLSVYLGNGLSVL